MKETHLVLSAISDWEIVLIPLIPILFLSLVSLLSSLCICDDPCKAFNDLRLSLLKPACTASAPIHAKTHTHMHKHAHTCSSSSFSSSPSSSSLLGPAERFSTQTTVQSCGKITMIESKAPSMDCVAALKTLGSRHKKRGTKRQ